MQLLTLKESAAYVYDAEAGSRPIRFIEKFCRHFEDRHAGKPFILHPIQKQIIGDVFGWKERETGLRRFRTLYIEGVVGTGKSPLAAALGIYLLCADGQRGAQLFNVGSNFSQARVVFESAKAMIELSPELSEHLVVRQYEIAHPASRSFWRVLSGVGKKSGMRPSAIIGDEVWQWKGRETFDDLQRRALKRTQPLTILMTNAPNSAASFCGQLSDEARNVLAGKVVNDSLYPVFFSADADAELDDPKAWRDANPLLGTTILEADIAAECKKAQGDPALEAELRRLYLGQRKQSADKWLDLDLWDHCTGEFDPAKLEKPLLYVGVDLSQCDDLSAVVWVWVTPERFYVRSHFWMPRKTARQYDKSDAIPYLKWGDEGFITLVDSPTISPEVKKSIAKRIIEDAKTFKCSIKAVCYDRYRADDCIAALEAAGVICMPIPQGYTVTPGCEELDRRLKEDSITIAANPIFRSNAELVEVTRDQRGNYWPVKPGYKSNVTVYRAAVSPQGRRPDFRSSRRRRASP